MEPKNEYITTTPPTAEQLKHREQLKQYAQQKRQRDLRNALVFKLGEMLLSCCPCVALLKVRRTKADNESEFALLQEFLLQVSIIEQYTTFRDKIASRAEASEK